MNKNHNGTFELGDTGIKLKRHGANKDKRPNDIQLMIEPCKIKCKSMIVKDLPEKYYLR